jgi:hypothetical protein
MNRSEIFDNFVKIAQDKGMISEDAPEKAKKKLSKDHRADSLDISAIEALYGVKPNTPKDMEYKRNIIEDAHPNSVVVSPAYDKLNGLVENDQERQNIILNILSKTPNGHLTQHKYAEKDLLMSLVRLGNALDLQKKNELRVLADVCLEQVATKQPIKKQAFVWIAGGIAATIGALYAQQHLAFADEGFQRNHEKLIAEVDDLINANSNWGVGNQYNAEFKTMVQDFKSRLMSFYNLYQKVLPIIKDLEKPKSVQELKDLALSPETATITNAYKVFRANTENMSTYLDTLEKSFSSESFKNRQIQEKGWISSLLDKTQLHGGKGLVADDFDDVVRGLLPYRKSIKEILDVLKTAESLEKDARVKIEQAMYKNQSEYGTENEPAAPQTTLTSNKPKSQLEQDDEDLTSLLG